MASSSSRSGGAARASSAAGTFGGAQALQQEASHFSRSTDAGQRRRVRGSCW